MEVFCGVDRVSPAQGRESLSGVRPPENQGLTVSVPRVYPAGQTLGGFHVMDADQVSPQTRAQIEAEAVAKYKAEVAAKKSASRERNFIVQWLIDFWKG